MLSGQGRKMAVATSSDSAMFSLKTGHHSWFSGFEVVVCGDDPELANPKPAPGHTSCWRRRTRRAPRRLPGVRGFTLWGVKAGLAARMRVG